LLKSDRLFILLVTAQWRLNLSYEQREKSMADENNKCGHEACVCAVGGDEKYCSPECESAGAQDITEIACDCGHAGCS